MGLTKTARRGLKNPATSLMCLPGLQSPQMAILWDFVVNRSDPHCVVLACQSLRDPVWAFDPLQQEPAGQNNKSKMMVLNSVWLETHWRSR